MPHAVLGDRSRFPALADVAYCNHAAISPPSRPVSAAARAVLADYEQRGVGAFFEWMGQRQRLREKLARFVGASADDIGFCANTTSAIRSVALCRPWQAGDRIVLFRGEFPANVTPWIRAAELLGLTPVWLDAAEFTAHGHGLQQLHEVLSDGAALVAVSAVQFSTGLRMPIAAMAKACHEHGAEICVDAIQACGAEPIDVVALDVDYLACGSHKWLMGLEGAAFLWVRPQYAAVMRPHLAGWLSHEEPVGFLFEGPGHLRYDRPIRLRPDALEGGAYNVIGLAAWEPAIDLLASLGPAAIRTHVQRYHDALEPGLLARGFASLREPDGDHRSAILSVDAPDRVDITALPRMLAALGVSCSLPDGRLRFAPHWPNALSEVPRVLDAVDEALQRLRDRTIVGHP